MFFWVGMFLIIQTPHQLLLVSILWVLLLGENYLAWNSQINDFKTTQEEIK
jgi:hypothetical protein